MNQLNHLEPRFRASVDELVQLCRERDFRLVPYLGYRSPADQARLWRQSRTSAQGEARIEDLRSAGAPLIASVLDSVGPQHGPHVTNAVPGESWHQFGLAVDCYIESPETSKALWRDKRFDEEEFGRAAQLYEQLGRAAEGLGLTWGGRWALGDFGHVQVNGPSSPRAAFGSWAALDRKLRSIMTR